MECTRADENEAMLRYQKQRAPEDLMHVVNSVAPILRGYFLKHGLQQPDVDDLLQEVWTRVIEHAGDFENRGNVRSWIFSTAMRVRFTLARKQQRAPESLEQDPVSQENAVANAIRNEEKGLLWGAVQHLPEHQRLVAEAWLRELSEQQISAELDIAVGTVKSRGSSMRKNLQHILESKIHN